MVAQVCDSLAGDLVIGAGDSGLGRERRGADQPVDPKAAPTMRAVMGGTW